MNKNRKIFAHKEKEEIHLLAPNFIAATKGDLDGEVDITWEPVKGAYTYIIQKRNEKNRNAKWEQVDIIDRSSYTISKLKSGKKYRFRVAAVNSKGQGPWSETVNKTAP